MPRESATNRVRVWRKVYVDLWDDPRFDGLTPLGQRLMFLAKTGRASNRVGLFRFSIAEAAEQLRADGDEVRRELQQICQAFGWRYDATARVLWVPEWFSENPPPHENALRGAIKDLIDLPATPLLHLFAEHGAADFDQDLFEHVLSDYLGDRWHEDLADPQSNPSGDHPLKDSSDHPSKPKDHQSDLQILRSEIRKDQRSEIREPAANESVHPRIATWKAMTR